MERKEALPLLGFTRRKAIEQWRRLQSAARPSLKQLLLAPEARTDELVPPRGGALRRAVVEL